MQNSDALFISKDLFVISSSGVRWPELPWCFTTTKIFTLKNKPDFRMQCCGCWKSRNNLSISQSQITF